LLDCSPTVQTQHLEAALAVWRYCDESARIIFGGVPDDSSGSKLDHRFLETVKRIPGISKTDLRNSVSKATPTDRIDAAIERLLTSGDIVRMLVVGHAGRTVESFYPGVSFTLDVGNWGFRDSQSETTTGNEIPTTVNPQIAESLSTSNVEPATLGELLDWRNLNSGTFTRRADGVVWVTTANGSTLPPAMEAAILANQATLTAFVPANAHTATPNVSDDEPLTADAQTLYDELVSVDDAPMSVTVAVDVDAFVAELNALQA